MRQHPLYMTVSVEAYDVLLRATGGPCPIRDYDHIMRMKARRKSHAFIDAVEAMVKRRRGD